MSQRGLAECRRDFVIRVAVVRPEHEGNVGLNLGHRFGDSDLRREIHIEPHSGEIQHPHLDAVVLRQTNRPFNDFLLASGRRHPV